MNTVTITLTHEEHHELMDQLRILKSDKFPVLRDNPYALRIYQARRALGMSIEEQYLFSDWTVEDQKKKLSRFCVP